MKSKTRKETPVGRLDFGSAPSRTVWRDATGRIVRQGDLRAVTAECSDGRVWDVRGDNPILVTHNVPVRRAVSATPPAAGSAICEATTTARRGDDDCGKWRRCELPAGHTGEHKTTYCGHDYCWPNAGAHGRAVARTVQPLVGGSESGGE